MPFSGTCEESRFAGDFDTLNFASWRNPDQLTSRAGDDSTPKLLFFEIEFEHIPCSPCIPGFKKPGDASRYVRCLRA
jgi:hypothetical protein